IEPCFSSLSLSLLEIFLDTILVYAFISESKLSGTHNSINSFLGTTSLKTGKSLSSILFPVCMYSNNFSGEQN
mgnify:CR=1